MNLVQNKVMQIKAPACHMEVLLDHKTDMTKPTDITVRSLSSVKLTLNTFNDKAYTKMHGILTPLVIKGLNCYQMDIVIPICLH